MVAALHAQFLSDIDILELQINHPADAQQPGQVRSSDALLVPAGYQDAVAEYFRRLSKNFAAGYGVIPSIQQREPQRMLAESPAAPGSADWPKVAGTYKDVLESKESLLTEFSLPCLPR